MKRSESDMSADDGNHDHQNNDNEGSGYKRSLIFNNPISNQIEENKESKEENKESKEFLIPINKESKWYNPDSKKHRLINFSEENNPSVKNLEYYKYHSKIYSNSSQISNDSIGWHSTDKNLKEWNSFSDRNPKADSVQYFPKSDSHIKNESFNSLFNQGCILKYNDYEPIETGIQGLNHIANNIAQLSIEEECRFTSPIQFYTQITGKTCEDENMSRLGESSFILHLNNKHDKEVMQNSSELMRLPNITNLILSHVPSKDDNVADFLCHVAPKHLKEFEFGGEDNNEKNNGLCNVELYSTGLQAVVSSTTKSVEFDTCKFSSSDLQSIFKAAKNVQVLKFTCCKLDVESGFDLSDEDYTIEELMLFRCGDIEYSDWLYDHSKLETLVEAISKSSLKLTLNKIDVYENDFNLAKEEIEEIFEKHDLQVILYLH